MKLIIASDHGGFELKTALYNALANEGHEIKDLGCFSEESVDYPRYAFKVAEDVCSGLCEQGILICTSGIGMSIAANKVKGARAALCDSEMAARMARNHNNANILVLGARFVDTQTALGITKIFMESGFDGGRHQRRVDMIDSYLPNEIK